MGHHKEAMGPIMFSPKVGLAMGAPTGYLHPDPQVFWVTISVPGPTKIFSHRSPGSMGQIPAGIPVLMGIGGYPQVYLQVLVVHNNNLPVMLFTTYALHIMFSPHFHG